MQILFLFHVTSVNRRCCSVHWIHAIVVTRLLDLLHVLDQNVVNSRLQFRKTQIIKLYLVWAKKKVRSYVVVSQLESYQAHSQEHFLVQLQNSLLEIVLNINKKNSSYKTQNSIKNRHTYIPKHSQYGDIWLAWRLACHEQRSTCRCGPGRRPPRTRWLWSLSMPLPDKRNFWNFLTRKKNYHVS
jgi:hypothetical protein